MIGRNVRILREYLKLSREKFGKRIYVSGDVINNLERERVQYNELLIDSICNEFHVRRTWLETGEGKMFELPAKNTIDKLAEEYNLGINGKALLTVALDALTTLDEKTSEMLIDRLLDKLREIKGEQSAVNPESLVVDEDDSDSSFTPQESSHK